MLEIHWHDYISVLDRVVTGQHNMHKHVEVAAGNFFLPPELWEEIYKRLVLSDRIRLSSLGLVSLKPDGPPPVTDLWPLLNHIVSGSKRVFKNRFHCLSDERVYTFGNVIPDDCRVLGTSNGWLLTNSYRNHLYMVNPILNARMRIIAKYNYRGAHDRMKKILVVETKLGSGDCTFVVLTKLGRLIVYINSEFYEQGSTALPSADFTVYKGKIHRLVKWGETIAIHVSRLDNVSRLETVHVVRSIKGPGKSYLVESRGELLIVRERYRYKNYIRPTGEFDVFKLVMANGFADAVKLQSLGDQAVFRGSDGCFSLTVGEFSLFEENHIYIIAPVGGLLSCEIRGFSLKDGSIKQISSHLPILPCKRTNLWWFVPTTEDITVNYQDK